MSIQNAKALYTKLLADDLFRKKLERSTSSMERRQILQEAGFSCTPQELKIAKNQLLQYRSIDRELTLIEEDMIQAGNSFQVFLDSLDRYLF